MAHDIELEARIDLASLHWPGMAKKAMFGGMGYLLRGNMAFGIWRDHLVVRCGPASQAACLALPHARPFDVTGKAMTGWIMVAPDGFEQDADLLAWLERGRDFAASLPEK
jgi:TfoX/Sxy family transcriptional regulator of competence genes